MRYTKRTQTEIAFGRSKSATFEAALCVDAAPVKELRWTSDLSWMQIKYLRVPDMLLDVVKEEQTRAREAGKSARGGAHSGGIGGRGMEHVLSL